MNLQLKAIVLYNTQGESRWLPFRLGKLNIITGLSKRGKSGIIDIVDYCMGRSTYSVFEGVNRGVVSWYAVVLSDGRRDIFIAKPEPEIGAKSQSGAYFKVGSFEIPLPFEQLTKAVNDAFVVKELSKILGFQTGLATFSQSSSKNDFEISVKHSKFFIFQEQGEIANKRILFHRQADEGVAAGIRDSLPVILGATRGDHLAIMEDLRSKRRELKLIDKEVAESLAISEGPSHKVMDILVQLIDVGVLNSDAGEGDARDALKEAVEWRPAELRIPDEDGLEIRRKSIIQLEVSLADAIRERDRTRDYLRHFSGFSDEMDLQRSRLEPIGLLTDTQDIHCPLCGTHNESVSDYVNNARKLLYSLRDDLSEVDLERPKLEAYLAKLGNKINEITSEIRNEERKIRATLDEREMSLKLRDRELAAARVVGKAALYLESTDVDSNQMEQMYLTKRQLENEIENLEGKVDLEAIQSRTEAILGHINAGIRKHAEVFQHEFFDNPFKLDIRELTVKVLTLEQEIPLLRQGSAENYLACHLSVFLALHDYFIMANRPVPRFMILDQPSQVHFPGRDEFYDVASDRTRSLVTDPEIDAVKRDLKGLHDACENHRGALQIIILEHANFPDQFFKEALVEPPWIGSGGLIPEEWL